MRIGERVTVIAPRSVCIDGTRPFFIEIGNDVKIARGFSILTHGYGGSVPANTYDRLLGSAGEVCIADNVFIGAHTTVLKDAYIGKNTVIGAGSLVTRDIPDHMVAAGNPRKVHHVARRVL